MRTKIDKQDARLDFQKMDMLNQHNAKLAEEAEKKEKDYHKTIFEEAYTGLGSYIHNKRVKEQAIERAYNYADHFTVLALTEALSNCVEKSLLLDCEEYAKLNPNYKTEIRETVKNFLENADINDKINNKITLDLYEAIKTETPLADLYLSEEEEVGIIDDHIMNKDTVERGLDTLSRDVRARVANIVTKDQEALSAEQDVLSHADEKEAEVAPMVPVEQEPAEEMPIADPDAPVEEAQPEAEQPLMEAAKAPRIKIVKEQEKRGILETLALNEAAKMIAEGKEYDKNLALANSIKYITILECLDASGIVSIGTPGYNRILSASGVNMNPVARVNIPGANIVDTPVATCPECEKGSEGDNVAPVKIELPNEDAKEKKVGNEISDLVKSAIPEGFLIGNSDDRVFEPFKKWKEENPSFGKRLADIPTKENTNLKESADLKGKYTNMKGEVFTEAALREFFEKQGFDLLYVDFDDLCQSWHFKKH